MACCATSDCGRLDCRPCYWARQRIRGGRSATTHDAVRDHAKAVPKGHKKQRLDARTQYAEKT